MRNFASTLVKFGALAVNTMNINEHAGVTISQLGCLKLFIQMVKVFAKIYLYKLFIRFLFIPIFFSKTWKCV